MQVSPIFFKRRLCLCCQPWCYASVLCSRRISGNGIGELKQMWMTESKVSPTFPFWIIHESPPGKERRKLQCTKSKHRFFFFMFLCKQTAVFLYSHYLPEIKQQISRMVFSIISRIKGSKFKVLKLQPKCAASVQTQTCSVIPFSVTINGLSEYCTRICISIAFCQTAL